MGGRQGKRKDRGKLCWGREPCATTTPVITAAQRELLRERLLADPDFFLSECVKCGIVTLRQLPCWPEIQEQRPDEALAIYRMARALGINA